MNRTILFATAALAVSPAFAGALQPATITAPAAADGLVRIALSAAAGDYATATSQVNTAEIAVGKLAESKSTNAGVKQFAAMMIKDHTAAEAKLKAIVDAEKGRIAGPAVSPQDAALKQKLQAASGAAFDKMYVQAMVEGHTAALKAQQAYAKSGDNAALKAFAADMSKAVAMHLQHAEALASKLGS